MNKVLERLYNEAKRRATVAVSFPNEDSWLRLVSAMLMEISEKWQAGRVRITLQPAA